MENEYEKKLGIFVDAVKKHLPKVICLQEIMQPVNGMDSEEDYIHVGNIPMKEGNHALTLKRLFDRVGVKYYLTWLGIKKSYGRFDEGLAIFSLGKPEKTDAVLLTPKDDYKSWKTRKALGVKINATWFYNVHTGWWDDCEFPLKGQLDTLLASLKDKSPLFLMGDFNSVASEREKGYDYIIKSGFFDTFVEAKFKDTGYTAHTSIDGWDMKEKKDVRIDYIFSSHRTEPQSSFTIFNGDNEEKISDHNGILLTL
jgi:maltose 6'-phosphate phosphatase